MRKLCFLILPLLWICGSLYLANEKDKIKEKKEVIPNPIDAYPVEDLTLEEKIGQMLIPAYRMTTIDETFQKELEQYQPGGFIFFQENFKSYEQTINLIETLEATAKIPLFLAIDQEGGNVQRLKQLEDVSITEIPAMEILGATNQQFLSYETGKVVARELQVFGINLNFAPVLDIVDSSNNKVIGTRSFGNNAEIVSNMAISFAQGLQDNGVIAVYKHFPGHGSTITDSHLDLPVLTKTKQELFLSDLLPFQKAIAKGADMIMVGHLAAPNLTGNLKPASLSKEIITDLLKNEMQYKGLIITDALNMKALTKYYSEKEIYELAIDAGVDILLMPTSLKSAVEQIKASILEGKITEERIDQSVQKILELKNKKLSKRKLGKEILGSENHQNIIEQIKNAS